MSDGTITREVIDRYSVVVMAGIAAEATQNGKAEGGQSDEAALIQFLGSLDGGRSWDLARIRNQARWASSQAALLLQEHGLAYQALSEALLRGESVGGCVMAIERGIDEAFGRNGELPAQTRARRASAIAETAPEQSTTGVVAPTNSAVVSAELEERQRLIDERLRAINEQLAREDTTWTG